MGRKYIPDEAEQEQIRRAIQNEPEVHMGSLDNRMEMSLRDAIYLSVRNEVIGKTPENPYPEVSQLDLRDVDKITNIVCSLINKGLLTVSGEFVF